MNDEKLCTKCKISKSIVEFNRRNDGYNTIYRSHCKSCIKKYKRDKMASNPEYDKTLRAKWRANAAVRRREVWHRFTHAKYKAKERNLDWQLTLEQYKALLQNKCYYDGNDLPQLGVGLDRLDSSIGYLPGNVVPCCAFCNRAKSSKTYESFYLWVETVYSNLKLKKGS